MPNALRDRAKWLKEKGRPRSRSSSRPSTPAPNSASDTNNAFSVRADSEDTADKLSVGSMSVTAMPDEYLQATLVSNNTNPNRLTVSVDRLVISAPVLGHGPTATAAKFPSTEEYAITGLTVTLRLVEKVANIINKVPVIAPAAALMSEILTIYEEVKNMSEERRTLLAKVEELSQDVCRMVLRMEATSSLGLIRQLKPDIDTYTELLIKASGYIREYDAQWKMLHALVAKDFARKFSALTQELVSFGSTFRSHRLVDLAITQVKDGKTLSKVHDMGVKIELEQWLNSPLDMKQKHEEIGNHRKPRTGLWILERNDFITWQHNPGSLWIRGPCRNSSLISIYDLIIDENSHSAVINTLLAYRQLFIARHDPKPPAVAFFYFDFKDKESHQVKKAFQDLVLQLSAQSPKCYQTLHELYVESNNGLTLPNYEALLDVFGKLILEIGDTYIVLDALGECQEPHFTQLLKLVSKLQSCQTQTTPLHILITSQPRNLFSETFKHMPFIKLSSHITHEDIKLFVSSELNARRDLKTWAPQAYITEQILQKSGGMFRLAVCLLDELSRCWPNQGVLNEILDSLPTELFGIYSWWLEAIHPDDFVYVQGALCWLMYHKSEQGLHLESLADVIAFNFSTTAQYMYQPADRMVNKEIIRGLEGLVALSHSSSNPQIVLAHASVKDYLLSRQFKEKFQCDLSADISPTFIAQTCTNCLLYISNHPLNEDTDAHPLAEYAAIYWSHHLVQAHDREILSTTAMQLPEEGIEQHDTLIRFYTKKHHSAPAPPLHLCCMAGYIEGVRALLTKTNIEIQDEECTPLHIASLRGHKDIAQLLVEKGANLNASMGQYGTLLQLAAAGMIKRDILLLLLAKGVDMNAKGGAYGTALQEASHRGDVGLVKLLVQEGANMNARGNGYGTALEVAAFSGQLKIVELLIGREVNMDSNGTGYMALQAAALGGWLDIVQCLLDSEAAVNAEDIPGPTPLQAALYGGHVDIAELFLERKADVNAQGEHFITEKDLLN
ncbi:hypothetical protein K438DRAFT_1825980 [Mycena galopus ATCC 62051]|nr:hypothetical protein K438DRAFT_1825980 [Mycena galopus ATCC 62051]